MVQRTSDRPKTTFGRPQWQIEQLQFSPLPQSTIPPTAEQAAVEDNISIPRPIWTPGIYGDMQYRAIVYLPAGGDQLALPRPVKTQRVYLLIQNNMLAGNITVNFDNQANALNGIQMPPGASWFMDNACPQNDIHIFAPGFGTVNLAFMEIDITDFQPILRTLHK